MRKGIKVIITISILVFVFVLVSKVDRTNYREGYVNSNDNGIITIVDSVGEEWEWEEEEGQHFNKGDNVILTMDNNNTIDKIEDDIILKIKVDK